ncbi:XRE family transcriptional regulator [Serratia sp. IR-2025]
MINTKIRQSRKAQKLTQEGLAKLLGLTKATISQWESGSTEPNGKNLIALARALKVSVDWLLDDRVTALPSEEPPIAEPARATDNLIEVPFYKDIHLSAGNGSYGDDQVSEREIVRLSEAMLHKANVKAHNAVCVRISGNSMEPVLPDSGIVAVDTNNREIVDGKMYAIEQEGMLRVKLLYRTPFGVRLRSYNDKEHPDEVYQGADANKIHVIGWVFWYSVLL